LKFRIIIDGKTYEIEYDAAESTPTPSVTFVDRVQSLVLPTPRGPAEASNIDESKVCRSPVAGIVTRIDVEPGEAVQEGQIVVVVDAMKMENNLTAAATSKVSAVKVKVGDPVKLGQILIEFE
jgi:methylmalonyl-CoA carboxyltransferase small subunit